jgi:hypothetical protein
MLAKHSAARRHDSAETSAHTAGEMKALTATARKLGVLSIDCSLDDSTAESSTPTTMTCNSANAPSGPCAAALRRSAFSYSIPKTGEVLA